MGLTEIMALDLSGNVGITDIWPLADLTTLSAVNLVNLPNLSDIKVLVALRTLRLLEVTGTQVSDISFLEGAAGSRLRGCPGQRPGYIT